MNGQVIYHLIINFKKIVYKIDKNVIHGNKLKYKNIDDNFDVEISVYNSKYKNIVLTDHNNGEYLPFYILIPLFVIKFLFYNLKILSKKTYKRLKRFLMNPNDELKFIELN